MTLNRIVFRRALLPIGTFVAVFAAHYLWLGLFPEQDPAQSGWAALPVERSWLRSYVDTQGYWLGYCYAVSLSFAAVAVRRYLGSRACDSPGCNPRGVALGSITFSGFLAAGGCFLIGCCGSPMLVVWMSLFGATFLPFAKPFLAALTTVAIVAAGWWVHRSDRRDDRSEQTATGAWETR
jgi:hypothetical protein